MKVLVTGAAGWTAEAVIRAFHEAGHRVFGFDLQDPAHWNAARGLLTGAFQGDIADPGHVDEVIRNTGAAAVVHLAVAVGRDDYRSPETPFRTNVLGTYNLLEPARRHGMQRVVLVSSAPVHMADEIPEPFDARTDWVSSPGGDHLYDLTKRLQEVMACDFAETHGLPVVILRAGHIVDGRAGLDPKGRALADLHYARGGWVCRYDLARACLRAAALDSSGCEAYHIIGAEAARVRFDIERTERELGLVFEKRFLRYD